MATRTVKRVVEKTTTAGSGGSVTYDPSLEPVTRAVAERTLLLEGITVSIRVPKKARKLTTPDGTPYVQFGNPVKGGFINFHVFGEPRMSGKRIYVEAKVFKKTMEGGEEYLYVDLHPSATRRLSHEIKIYHDATQALKEENLTIFPCYGKIVGAIGFLPIDHEARAASV